MKSHNFQIALKKYYSQEKMNQSKVDMHMNGHLEKLNVVNAGYFEWMDKFLNYMSYEEKSINPKNKLKILDIGCGTGELVVLMNMLGHEAYGIDLHREHLDLAKILASENEIDESIFIYNDRNILPFEDNHFDLITSFSVFEHLEDEVLEWMLPELNRICRGCIFTLVPNPIKPIDDHTGLAFLGHLNRRIAITYIKLRGSKYHYSISRSGEWDVYYRYLGKITKLFNKNFFELDYLPDELIYPSLNQCPPVHKIGKEFKIFGRKLFIGIYLFHKFFIKIGWPKQAFYPYLCLVSRPIKNKNI